MKPATTAALSILAGAAVLEIALIPGLVIGAAAIMAPKFLAKTRGRSGVGAKTSPGKTSRARPIFASPPSSPPAPGPNSRKMAKPLRAPPSLTPASPPAKDRIPVWAAPLAVKQAIFKTMTYRIVVTSLDFSTNYVVLGEIATAAGLSAFALVAGPIFYFVHETAWNRFGASENAGDRQFTITLRPGRGDPKRFSVGRAVAKTATFRTIATVMDFTTNYVVVGDALTAAGLSATGFVLGPFVYLGHELVWDRYGFAGAAVALPSGRDLHVKREPHKVPLLTSLIH